VLLAAIYYFFHREYVVGMRAGQTIHWLSVRFGVFF